MEEDLRYLLAKYNLSLKKAFGQNFLTDGDLLQEIVEKAGVEKNDTVLEIGCGAGALTRILCKSAKRVIGYEIDKTLKPLLTERLKEFDNIELNFVDVMKEKVSEIEKGIDGGYKIVANLPYYITTPIIMKFIENSEKLKSMSIMVQEEVAERLASKAGTSEYGAITVGINLRGSASIIKRVGREKFTPPPNVDSAVVRIDIEKEKFNGTDFSAVREVVRCGFSSRRKMLLNNLMKGYKKSRQELEDIFNSLGIKPTVRAEELTSEQFVNLSLKLK